MAPCLRRYVTVFCISKLANHSTCTPAAIFPDPPMLATPTALLDRLKVKMRKSDRQTIHLRSSNQTKDRRLTHSSTTISPMRGKMMDALALMDRNIMPVPSSRGASIGSDTCTKSASHTVSRGRHENTHEGTRGGTALELRGIWSRLGAQ